MTRPVDRDLSPEMAAVMAACRLSLSPDDAAALADLRRAAGQMAAVDGESAARMRFRLVAQECALMPGPDALARLSAAMVDFNRADLLPLAPPPEDVRPGRGRANWQRRAGGNGVAAAMPRDPADLYTDL
ncbi:hypothetical protein [Niveispirillum fermenti]|uniref:hypothetical protein n=1 Tax=Niveispirillum fermenti TaxID=1233113 RepID=UPI003A855868